MMTLERGQLWATSTQDISLSGRFLATLPVPVHGSGSRDRDLNFKAITDPLQEMFKQEMFIIPIWNLQDSSVFLYF